VSPLGAVPGLAGHGPAGGGSSPVSEASPSELVVAGSLVSTGGELESVVVDGVTDGDGGVTVVDGVTGATGGVTGSGPDVDGGAGGVTEVVDELPLGVTGGTTGPGDVGVTLVVVVDVVGVVPGPPESVSPQPAANSNTKQDAVRVRRKVRKGDNTGPEPTTDDKRMNPVLAQPPTNLKAPSSGCAGKAQRCQRSVPFTPRNHDLAVHMRSLRPRARKPGTSTLRIFPSARESPRTPPSARTGRARRLRLRSLVGNI
jgi:hypothetical protein